MPAPLTTGDHDRARGGAYVYPVVSRRARGVSVGVNLNPNNACNWRCVYCQVPGLVRGNAPPIDLGLLEQELNDLLSQAMGDAWLASHAPEGLRRLNDVALSGNGEPTSSKQLPEVLDVIARVLEALGLLRRIKVVLITNGSQIHLEHVQRSIRRLAELSGEVWFKVDSATDAGLRAVNDYNGGALRQRRNLESCAAACPTWIQTCLLRVDGVEPSAAELDAYLEQIAELRRARVPLEGVHLYSIARASHQPEAPRLSALGATWLDAFAKRIEAEGLRVQVSP